MWFGMGVTPWNTTAIGLATPAPSIDSDISVASPQSQSTQQKMCQSPWHAAALKVSPTLGVGSAKVIRENLFQTNSTLHITLVICCNLHTYPALRVCSPKVSRVNFCLGSSEFHPTSFIACKPAESWSQISPSGSLQTQERKKERNRKLQFLLSQGTYGTCSPRRQIFYSFPHD